MSDEFMYFFTASDEVILFNSHINSTVKSRGSTNSGPIKNVANHSAMHLYALLLLVTQFGGLYQCCGSVFRSFLDPYS